MSNKGRAIAFSILSLICCAIIAYGVLGFSSETVYEKIYPLEYEETIDKMCKERNLSKSFVYAIIKTESNFDEKATSPVGAKGLMQLMPESFSWIQNVEHGEVLYGEEMLLDAQINIKYGCILLEFLCERYQSELTAAAAYNAGLGNVDNWLTNREYSKDGKTLDVIPFSETRKYVERIESIRNKYKEFYNFD